MRFFKRKKQEEQVFDFSNLINSLINDEVTNANNKYILNINSIRISNNLSLLDEKETERFYLLFYKYIFEALRHFIHNDMNVEVNYIYNEENQNLMLELGYAIENYLNKYSYIDFNIIEEGSLNNETPSVKVIEDNLFAITIEKQDITKNKDFELKKER